MHISVSVDTADAAQAVLRLGIACAKPAPMLKWMGALTVKYLKANAGTHSFEPRAPETEAAEQGNAAALRRADQGIKRLRSKLRGDLRRAIRRDTGDRNAFQRLASADARMRRYLALKEFDRLTTQGFGGDSMLGKKAATSLTKRIVRAAAQAQSQSRPILGKLPSAHKATVAGNQLDVASPVTWAGAQNDGGVVGNGAKLPPRTWLAWWPPLMTRLNEVPVDVAMKAFAGE